MEERLEPNQKEEGLATGSDLPQKIPFQLGATLKLRSAADLNLKAQTTIVGVIENIAILVEDPVFAGDRLAGRVGGEILCAYVLDGYIFKFKSRFGQFLVHNVICIDYPKYFDARQRRKHPRIKVDLEAVCLMGKEGRLINGDIKDISEGGCLLELPGLIPVAPGMPVSVTFVLPNDEQIEDLDGTIMNFYKVQELKKTVVGLSFATTAPGMLKLKKFCDMCGYFRV